MENPEIPHNPFNDNYPTTEQKTEQLISIQEIGSPDVKSIESENGFVSLDINELQQKSQISGKIQTNTSISDSSSLSTREKNLKQREIELQQKEQELKAKYGNFDTIISIPDDNTPKKEGETTKKEEEEEEVANWPHPKYAAYLYHNIESDIPKEMRFLVETGYRTWKLTTVGYLINLITIGFAAFSDNYYESGLEKSEAVFTSLLWAMIATPVGFLLWYMNLYRLAKKFSTKNWLVFYVTFGCHMLFTVIILSGCPWYPCAGIFFTITCIFGRHIITTILSVINCIIWSIVLILSMAIFNSVKQMFNTKDKTKEVKGDFKNTFAKILSFAM